MDYEEAMEYYLEAKALWKKDFRRLIIFSAIWAGMFFTVMIVNSFSVDFEQIATCLLGAILLGFMAACAIAGVVKAFAFAWCAFTGWSVIFVLIVFMVGVSVGGVIVLVKLISGGVRIRKLGKILHAK